MTISLNISDQAQEMLRHAFGDDLSHAALEAIALEGYRSGKLSRFDIQKLLGFDNRWETEEWLGTHGANLTYSLADLEADRKTLDHILGPTK